MEFYAFITDFKKAFDCLHQHANIFGFHAFISYLFFSVFF